MLRPLIGARVAAAVALGAVAGGCQLVLELGDKVYVEAGDAAAPPPAVDDGGGRIVTADATVAGEAGAPPPDARAPVACPPGAKGAAMVLVGGAFCVDATEVTRGQYEEFVAATNGGIDVGGQPPACSWNTTYRPGASCETSSTYSSCSGAACAVLPQACVDWCDAYAYCKWAGKRLCGSPEGGPASLASLTDPATSQWTAACTSGGRNAFPYGESYVPLACPDDGDPAAPRRPKPVATHPDCQSKEPGYEGVFDLSGNVAEWEDACVASSGSNDRCRVRGGTFAGTNEWIRCDYSLTVARNMVHPEFGFRCCAP